MPDIGRRILKERKYGLFLIRNKEVMVDKINKIQIRCAYTPEDIYRGRRILKERKYGPFIIRDEEVDVDGKNKVKMRGVWSPEGLYVGDTKIALKLWRKYGIQKFFTTGRCLSKVACVGYNPKDKVWHGWSHRAIGHFWKGKPKKKGNLPYPTRFYKIANPRLAAEAFAREVS